MNFFPNPLFHNYIKTTVQYFSLMYDSVDIQSLSIVFINYNLNDKPEYTSLDKLCFYFLDQVVFAVITSPKFEILKFDKNNVPNSFIDFNHFYTFILLTIIVLK